jgi:hypothetical protein
MKHSKMKITGCKSMEHKEGKSDMNMEKERRTRVGKGSIKRD